MWRIRWIGRISWRTARRCWRCASSTTGEIPIYTKVRDAVPTLFGYNGQAANCLIADGCHLFGKAENSVIFREVDIEEGAEVRDSIVMQGSRIGAGASIRYCILDKNVTIRPGTKLLGSKDHPLVVDKGDTV